MFAMRVHVLALDDVFDLGLSAVLDAFQTPTNSLRCPVSLASDLM